MPGVQVTTLARAGAGAPLDAPSSTWFVAGVTERGDVVNPVELRGIADYTRKLGDPVTYGTLYDQLVTFFQEGGQRAYVARVVGPAATTGTTTLKDAGAAGGANTLRVDAASPGGWSSRLNVAVLAGSDPNTFRIQVLLDGLVVEDWQNLASPAAAVAAAQNSVYVRITDLGSATVAPGNNPIVLAATAMTTQGTDDRASITDAIRVAALARFGGGLNDGAVSIPGSFSVAVYDGIAAHCAANNRIGLLSGARGTTSAALTASAQAQGAKVNAEFTALIAPWILVPDGKGGSVAQGPLGYAAACRARAHSQDGPWRIPAGDIATATYVSGVDAPFDDATADVLDAARVSVVRVVGGSPTMYGWRSLSQDEADYYWLKNRDTMNYIAVQARARLRAGVFKNIDARGHLLNDVKNRLKNLMEPIRAAAGVFEGLDPNTQAIIDPGYSIDVGPDVNSLASMQAQGVAAILLVRPSPGASLIKLAIGPVPLTSPV